MVIPYDLIRQLEDRYGSISLVPESNSILKNIRKKLGATEISRIHGNYDYDKYREEQIINYINQGYGVYETASNLKLSYRRIHNVIVENGLNVKPKFKHCIEIDGLRVFCSSLKQFKANYLKTRNYKLITKKDCFYWYDIRTGDKYIVDCQVNTK